MWLGLLVLLPLVIGKGGSFQVRWTKTGQNQTECQPVDHSPPSQDLPYEALANATACRDTMQAYYQDMIGYIQINHWGDSTIYFNKDDDTSQAGDCSFSIKRVNTNSGGGIKIGNADIAGYIEKALGKTNPNGTIAQSGNFTCPTLNEALGPVQLEWRLGDADVAGTASSISISWTLSIIIGAVSLWPLM